MAVACRHKGSCDPSCHNYRPPHDSLEKSTYTRLLAAQAEVRECKQVLELIGRVRKADELLGRIDMAHTIGRGVVSTLKDIKEYVATHDVNFDKEGNHE